MILHVDMDAFYASVEERDRPELVGQPVIVGGTPKGRGVVAAANYKAREFGVHSAMSAAQAVRLCPHGVFIRPRMKHYAGVSRQLTEIFGRYTPLIEPLSLDEAFLDVSASLRLFGKAEEIARRIKDDVRRELGLVASVGVAPNKFLAKLASDLEKPDGLVVVPADGIQAFLDPLPVGRLWGVGKVSSRTLANLGVRTIRDLRQLPEELLNNRLGKWGAQLMRLANGVDNREVVPDRDTKSISHETTFETDIQDHSVLRSWLLALTEQVAIRLRRHKLMGGAVFIKVRYGDFSTVTRSHRLGTPTGTTKLLWREASDLLAAQLKRRPDAVRLLGMGVNQITPHDWRQDDLFDQYSGERQREIDAVADEIRSRFGEDAVKRGGGARRPR